MGAPGAGVGNGRGKAARRATVAVGVTCGTETAPPVFPAACEVIAVMLAPLPAPPPNAVGS